MDNHQQRARQVRGMIILVRVVMLAVIAGSLLLTALAIANLILGLGWGYGIESITSGLGIALLGCFLVWVAGKIPAAILPLDSNSYPEDSGGGG